MANEPIAPAIDSWQESMKRAIRTPNELLQTLHINPSELDWSHVGQSEFPLFAPLEFVARMERGNPRDPLFLQVWPAREESQTADHFRADPVGDLAVEKAPGLLHKYQGRVLMIASGACAIHCRYCFRRHYPYETAPKSMQHWEESFLAIERDSSIREVILSGGDPLSLVDATLTRWIDRIEAIPHVHRLRLHTRLPVVIPSRVTTGLVERLARSRLAHWVVLHINHANEIDDAVAAAIARLRNAGSTVLNQAVLLRGVNDDPDSLTKLFERLIDLRVGPYYLHQLDRVQGAAHWEVPETVGRELLQEVRKRLPGYAVPLYVREIAGEENKTPL
ncbi:L-lysine 2,3-aminomutase [Pirellula sp. SH-Sr6A]|uniref:EF-P beta-lysylation protein EpmB n=1 Tax=Pirellula sp. SH-Sr6A TaxID=1632865 RepID=UPI00078BBECF|nr:EF-P beta-lysylation protein EpmB [Pirellula sp. SH-Sr6A]AMV32318.1 L-lysine 2,3-aminomutase [Pirellula sp. SH-Sr6A]